uniref:Uncharacterized protein n=1 Tax=Plectus sambesii TaxID=2011161 RepID=A0A914WJL5_9BILA
MQPETPSGPITATDETGVNEANATVREKYGKQRRLGGGRADNADESVRRKARETTTTASSCFRPVRPQIRRVRLLTTIQHPLYAPIRARMWTTRK